MNVMDQTTELVEGRGQLPFIALSIGMLKPYI